MVELAQQAECLRRLELVHGAKSTVDQLLSDPRVRAVSFVAPAR